MRKSWRILLLCFAILWSLAVATEVVAQADDEPVLEPGIYLDGAVDSVTLQADLYFDGEAGTVVNWIIESGFGDEYLRFDDVIVFAPDGSELDRIDEFYFPHAYFPQHRLVQTGRYHIVIHAQTAGIFQAVYQIRETPNFDDARYFFEDRLYGSTVGHLDFVFTAEAGETIQSRVTARSFDAVLTLVDPAGNVVATDDDGLRDLNPVIGPITLEQAGEYRLVVESYNPADGGPFTLYLQRAAAPPADAIMYGEPVTVTLDSATRLRQFGLEGSFGDVVEMVLDDPDGIAQVRLVDYDRNVISTKDTDFRLYDDWSRFILPNHNRYRLVIAARDDAAAGTVTVQFNLLDQHSLDGVTQTTEFHVSSKDPIRRFSFTGYSNAQATVSIVQSGYEADVMPYRITLRDAEDNILSQMVIDDVVGSFSLTNTAAVGLVSGPITLELELLGEGPAWFELSLALGFGEG